MTVASVDRYRLSVGQQALLFLHRLEPASSAYNVAAGVRVHEPVDLTALTRSVQLVALRHELLRSYYEDDLTASSRLLCPEPPAVAVHDAHGYDEHRLHALVERLVTEPFQLDRRPPFRVLLIRAGGGEDILLTVIHHIATDLSSQLTVLRELLRFYADSLGRHAFAPPAVAQRFQDHVAREETFLRSPQRAVAEEYWRRVCEGAGEIPFLSGRPSAAAAGEPAGEQMPLAIDGGLARAVEAAARDRGTTVFRWLMAAFQLAVLEFGGRPDFLVGYPVTLRQQAGQRHAVGYYVNVVPLRVSPARSATFQESLEWNRVQVSEGLAHQRYPLAMMPCVLGPARPDGRPPVQASFNMMTAYPRSALGESLVTGERVELAGIPVSGFPIPQQIGQTPLAMDAFHVPGRIAGRLKYRTGAVTATNATALMDGFVELLERTARPRRARGEGD